MYSFIKNTHIAKVIGIERTGTGIERTGTSIRVMLFAVICAATFFSQALVAAPQAHHVGGLTISTADNEISVSWHKALGVARMILGRPELTSNYVSIPLFTVVVREKVQGAGTGKNSSIGLEPWGEMELSLNVDGSIEGIITGFSNDKAIEEYIFELGTDAQFLVNSNMSSKN